jgi:hypothetical protein
VIYQPALTVKFRQSIDQNLLRAQIPSLSAQVKITPEDTLVHPIDLAYDAFLRSVGKAGLNCHSPRENDNPNLVQDFEPDHPAAPTNKAKKPTHDLDGEHKRLTEEINLILLQCAQSAASLASIIATETYSFNKSQRMDSVALKAAASVAKSRIKGLLRLFEGAQTFHIGRESEMALFTDLATKKKKRPTVGDPCHWGEIVPFGDEDPFANIVVPPYRDGAVSDEDPFADFVMPPSEVSSCASVRSDEQVDGGPECSQSASAFAKPECLGKKDGEGSEGKDEEKKEKMKEKNEKKEKKKEEKNNVEDAKMTDAFRRDLEAFFDTLNDEAPENENEAPTVLPVRLVVAEQAAKDKKKNKGKESKMSKDFLFDPDAADATLLAEASEIRDSMSRGPPVSFQEAEQAMKDKKKKERKEKRKKAFAMAMAEWGDVVPCDLSVGDGMSNGTIPAEDPIAPVASLASSPTVEAARSRKQDEKKAKASPDWSTWNDGGFTVDKDTFEGGEFTNNITFDEGDFTEVEAAQRTESAKNPTDANEAPSSSLVISERAKKSKKEGKKSIFCDDGWSTPSRPTVEDLGFDSRIAVANVAKDGGNTDQASIDWDDWLANLSTKKKSKKSKIRVACTDSCFEHLNSAADGSAPDAPLSATDVQGQDKKKKKKARKSLRSVPFDDGGFGYGDPFAASEIPSAPSIIVEVAKQDIKKKAKKSLRSVPWNDGGFGYGGPSAATETTFAPAVTAESAKQDNKKKAKKSIRSVPWDDGGFGYGDPFAATETTSAPAITAEAAKQDNKKKKKRSIRSLIFDDGGFGDPDPFITFGTPTASADAKDVAKKGKKKSKKPINWDDGWFEEAVSVVEASHSTKAVEDPIARARTPLSSSPVSEPSHDAASREVLDKGEWSIPKSKSSRAAVSEKSFSVDEVDLNSFNVVDDLLQKWSKDGEEPQQMQEWDDVSERSASEDAENEDW